MIELDEAAPHLRPLVSPTLAAFEDALSVASAIEKATVAVRARMTRPVLATIDGVTHWGCFATSLAERYAAVGVHRDDHTHPLMYAWDLTDRIRIQLKSDTNALPVEQLIIPGMSAYGSVGAGLVALTWSHDSSGRFGPTFVHRTADAEIWRVPVAALLDVPAATVNPPVAKATITSRLTPASDGEKASDAER